MAIPETDGDVGELVGFFIVCGILLTIALIIKITEAVRSSGDRNWERRQSNSSSGFLDQCDYDYDDVYDDC